MVPFQIATFMLMKHQQKISRKQAHLTPKKTNTTGWKIHHFEDVFNYSKW